MLRSCVSVMALIAISVVNAGAQDATPSTKITPSIQQRSPQVVSGPPNLMDSLPVGDGGAMSSNSLADGGTDPDAPAKRVEAAEPIFFDPRTGEPAIWYYKNKSAEIELFDKKGFHPLTGEALLPITREVVEVWKAQAARRTPTPIDDPRQFGFFDPLTGSAKVWFRRTETGKYEFFDGPGYSPGSGEPLSIVTPEIVSAWQQSLDKSAQKRCYVITRDAREPVRYGNQSGFDPITGRQCRELTPEIVERLREYEKGNRPKRIDAPEPTFFDPRTGEPVVWYLKNRIGDVEIFDLMGFHPETGDELLPITKEIVDLWKSQRDRRTTPVARAAPQRVDSEKYPFFDPVTGDPRVWYWRSEAGAYEFYDSRGFQPRTGDALQPISKDVIAKWKQEIEAAEQRKKEEQLRREREQGERAERQERERIAALEAQERVKQAASRCDQLAGNPNDPRRAGPGVPYDVLKMQARDALEACTAAIAANPNELRFKYQLGRALEFVDRKRAFEIQSGLVKLRYPAAYDNLGWMLFYDRKDISQAISHFRMGVELGDPDSMVSLADMIDRGAFNPPNSIYVKLSLFKRAAELGDQAAVRAYNAEMEKQQEVQTRQINEQEMQRRMLDAFGAIIRSVPRR